MLQLLKRAAQVASLVLATATTGCSRKPDVVEAFDEVLSEVRLKSEQHTASEMISSLNSTVVQHFSIRDVECPHSEGGMYARVYSPSVEDGLVRQFEPNIQDWAIDAGCYNHPRFKDLSIGLDLHLEANGTTGTGTMSGMATIKNLTRCDFAFDLTFDVATGQVLTLNGGDVCGQTLVAEDLVVPFLL